MGITGALAVVSWRRGGGVERNKEMERGEREEVGVGDVGGGDGGIVGDGDGVMVVVIRGGEDGLRFGDGWRMRWL